MNEKQLLIDQCVDLTKMFIEKINEIDNPDGSAELFNIVRDFFKYLNLSLLSGEYVQDSTFENRLVELLKDLQSDFSTLTDRIGVELDISIEDYTRYTYISEFVKASTYCLAHYRAYVNYFWCRVKNPEKRYLLNHFDTADIINFDYNSFDLKDSTDLFSANISLSIIDISLALKDDSLRKLYSVLNRLDERKDKNDPIPKLLKEKCDLLIFKFKLKFESDDDLKSLLIYEQQFDPDSIKLSHLSDIQTKIRSFYPSSSNSSSLREYYLLHKNNSTYSNSDYFAFVRYYKEKHQSVDEIDKLICKYEELSPNDNLFDKRSYNICLNYLFNNKVSLIVDSSTTTVETVDELTKTVISMQNDTDVKNFFPHYKISQFYSRYIEKEFKTPSIPTDKLDYLREVNKALKSSIGIARRYLSWDISHFFLPYQPCYEECCYKVAIDDEEFNIFIMSSFVIPVDYEKERKQIDEMELDYRKFAIMIDMHDSISQEKGEIENAKSKINEAKKEIEQAKKNNIEVLSIFAAIVMFVSSNIQIFSRVSDLRSASVFTLSFAYVMSLFVILIWFVVNTHRNKEKEKLRIAPTQWWIIVFLFLGLLANLYFIFLSDGYKFKPDSDENVNNIKCNIEVQEPTKRMAPDLNTTMKLCK